MRIKNVTREKIEQAVDITNKSFDNNVWACILPVGRQWKVRLYVHDSREPGHRLGFSHRKDGGRRYMVNACWHVHGTFFDSLPREAVIVANGRTIRPGDRWQDKMVGSIMQPVYFSKLCDC